MVSQKTHNFNKFTISFFFNFAILLCKHTHTTLITLNLFRSVHECILKTKLVHKFRLEVLDLYHNHLDVFHDN